MNGIDSPISSPSRRRFLKQSAGLATSTVLWSQTAPAWFAAGSDTIRVGLIGCGGRGTGAATDCVRAAPGVEIVALGDLFRDRLDECHATLKRELADKCRVTADRCFVGFDAYQQVIATDLDLVLLATPAHFRPRHLRAAIDAGRHVFMEKPVAVDPVGNRVVVEAGQRARAKGLAIVAGAQRRHDPKYVEVMQRIHDGAIGEITGGQCYWFRGHLWVRERQPAWSDMEWQIRNFVYFTWLCGDCVVETLLHNIDVINWAFGTHPISALGLGGRQVRTQPQYGQVYDHFTIEYEYAAGVRTVAMSREMPQCTQRVSERIVGTKGVALCDAGRIEGEHPYAYTGPAINPYVQEHADLIASLRQREPLNEAQRMAESNLTAVMGRMSAYTGLPVTWDWAFNHSVLDLSPPRYVLGDLPSPVVAMPGQTELT
jgi:myo-inositol 2-dehydrogenase / D-chiro-inositol 1-dehydrogenase